MNVVKTITSIFIVPTLKIPREMLNSVGFINGYLYDEDREIQYENAVYLLFKLTDIDLFRDFLEKEYLRTNQILEEYDYEDNFVVLVYKLNTDLDKDFELVRLGKYSQTSKEFQSLFPKIVKVERGNFVKEELSLQHRIFSKTEDLINYWENKLGTNFKKDQEVWSIQEKFKETLNIKFIKKIYEK